MRLFHKPYSIAARVPAGIISAAFVLGLATAGQAAPTVKEVYLATPAQALKFCMGGKMLPSDIAYIAGPPGEVQYGPGSNCQQAVPPKKTDVKKAIQVNGNHVSECKMVGTAQALSFCESGNMGTYDIDYISGKVGRTLSGPGYGCVVNYSTSSIGNAVCK